MKKILAGLLSLCMISGLVIMPVSAETEGSYTYEVSDGEAKITGFDSLIDSEITIPSTLGGYPVTSIGDYAFYERASLTSISIPEGVTSIGDYAFCQCASLTSISIPEGVISIGDYAFCACYSLISVSIPKSVTSIGDYAFLNCFDLASISIQAGVTSIGNRAFCDCHSLTNISIPESVTSIGDDAFLRCTSLTSINVDEANGNYSSQEGVLLNKDKTILLCYPSGKEGYYWIPEDVTSIGDDAFIFCSSLTSIIIPESVTNIGNDAFLFCENLTDVYYTGSKDQWDGISIGSDNECLTNATIHYNYTFPEISLEAIEKDITIDKTVSKNGTIMVSISSDGRNISDIHMFVSTHKDGLMTNASEAAKEVADGKVTFTSAIPFANGRIFIWDSNQRPLTKVSEIE